MTNKELIEIFVKIRNIMSKNILMVNGRPVKNTTKKDVYKFVEFLQSIFMSNLIKDDYINEETLKLIYEKLVEYKDLWGKNE